LKKSILLIGKILLPTFLVLVFSIVTLLPIPVVTRADPKTTVYLDPPTINGTAFGEEFTVNLMIRDAVNVSRWQAGMIFNSTLLNCTGFNEGDFLKKAGSTLWQRGTINNTAGVITAHASVLLGELYASGDGILAYLTFKVKAAGVSNIHLRDVKVGRGLVTLPVNIIDVYTVVLDATAHTVVIVSNSTGLDGWYHSGFYAHAFNPALKELSFNVTGPHPGFSNVTIPKTLLPSPEPPIEWKVVIDGDFVDRTVTENSTHTSIYFTYSLGIHKVQITTRMSSIISIALSSTSIIFGSNVTISGNITREDYTGRPYVTVTIQSRPIGAATWYTVDTVETDSNSDYTYTWTPETGGTHEVMASWDGDEETFSAKSDMLALMVLYVFEPLPDVYVVIETNSTVAEFNSIPRLNFSQPLRQISFNVTSPYGTIGYSNVTIPKTLLNVTNLDEWRVVMNGTLLGAGERIVTENTTHTSIYFTYSKGFNIIEITTRMSSTISLALSADSIDLGENVTISGSVIAGDQTVRPNVNVTISYRLRYAVTWDTLDTVETDLDGNYTHVWTPEAAGIYEVMASWEGDEETLGAKSGVQTLTVMESSTISIALSSTNITFGSNVIISGEIDPLKPNMPVTIQYRLIGEAFWTAAGQNQTDQDSRYTFKWTPTTPGTYEVRAMWLGDDITYGATSSVLTLAAKWTSTISIALSSPEITRGKSVTISGNITATDNIARENVTVTLLYKPSGEEWISLANVTTNANGNYTYSWKPEAAGTYEVMASWEGDDTTFGNESAALPLTVKEAPVVIPLEIVAVVVVAIIVIAAIVVYFVKFRKP